ncbi:hypothetical protein TTHERM_000079589 (macronuclear) [Tetrahymena thermophila SB210]|uniref:Kinase domain protein n=1 Tax=Tetrahymena thermophila (strain SB210) TaxID=312017 RepID=W7XAT2_TETTS|nr:hypothetical protein TTHERM_000079589 [Tetrahymena thermophila SB210]EWS74462.1 hypothetical protein TTHERM_000079589 [Tetrahymena thermophila SB210]|eukprot:XP_012653039.1 hypothetical protein TTHERM_000079589 [Tetrahymena thermophila SB210]
MQQAQKQHTKYTIRLQKLISLIFQFVISQKSPNFETRVEQIGQSLQSLTNLSNFELEFKFDQQKTLGICSILENCKNLSSLKLKLNNNEITDDMLSQMCQSLSSCKNNNLQILVLDFSNNQITDDMLSQMCYSFSSCKNLSHLELILKNNYLQCICGICSPLLVLNNLQILVLDFSKNIIKGLTVSELGSALSKCFNLISLEFWLDDVTIFVFAKYLPNIINLRNLKLHLEHNSVSEDQEKQLSIFVLKLKKLVQKQISIF